MKKERIILFPGNEGTSVSASEEKEVFLTDVLPGHSYRIGKPSDTYYRYLFPTLVPKRSKTKLRPIIKEIQGTVVTVSSIIRMVDGKWIAALRPIENPLFLDRFEKIFAQVDGAIASREIIQLDL